VKNIIRQLPQLRLFTLALILLPLLASADSVLEYSGFGTLGGAVSDQNFNYQRQLNDGGTFSRDSVLGVQFELDLAPAWSLTTQLREAAATDDDNRWKSSLTWAFLSWRRDNDELLRLGKLRLPLMLYSANSDVGTSFDFARLPTEVYSLLPTTDVTGLSFTKTWLGTQREWTLEGYMGRGYSDWRTFWRKGIVAPHISCEESYTQVKMDIAGAVALLHTRRTNWRLAVHHGRFAAAGEGVPADMVLIPFPSPIGPAVSYRDEVDGSHIPMIYNENTLYMDVMTLGFDFALPQHFQLLGEFGRRRLNNHLLGQNTDAAYLALLKHVGRWTPYVYWAGIRSSSYALGFATAMNDTVVPDSIPDADALTRSQRIGADSINAFDQYSVALGTSYRLTSASKLKLEWLHTRTGAVSSFVDPPPGEESGGRQINVFSLSYNFTF
jgi:hypothetical protein